MTPGVGLCINMMMLWQQFNSLSRLTRHWSKTPKCLGYHALGVIGKKLEPDFVMDGKIADFFDIAIWVYTIYFNDVSRENLFKNNIINKFI